MARLPLHLNNPVPVRFRSFRSRVLLVVGLLVVAGLAIVWRSIDLQVLQYETLSNLAQRQSQRVFKRQGKRGEILDRKGGRLAVSVRAESLYAHPSLVRDPGATAIALAPLLQIDRDILERQLSSDNGFVWLQRKLLPSQADKVQTLDIPGLGFTTEFRRVYPSKGLAAALLGFTGIDSQGLEGLEYAYDSYLRGSEQLQVLEKDALGRVFAAGEADPPAGGGSVTLTLHPAIQYISERELEKAVVASEAKVGVVIVMDSPTGELLAVSQSPGFNPNEFQQYDKKAFFNRAVTSGYEPGSTFKIFTIATGLETGAIKSDSLFFCEDGRWEHYDSVVHDTSPHGWLVLEKVMAVSSNICAAKIGLTIPAASFRNSIHRFGFGRRLGLFNTRDGRRLAGEAEGYVLPVEKWTPVDHAAISFGHGILVSPLQLTSAVNTIATGGRRMTPRLVSEIRDATGVVVERNRPYSEGRVISQQTAKMVTDFMVGVVQGKATGWRAAIPGYVVAGKTGTTEKYDLKARGYSKTRQIASFVGFVPANKPRLTILVVIEEPLQGRSGGVVAAPVFREIARRALPLLGVWPDNGVERKKMSKLAAQ